MDDDLTAIVAADEEARAGVQAHNTRAAVAVTRSVIVVILHSCEHSEAPATACHVSQIASAIARDGPIAAAIREQRRELDPLVVETDDRIGRRRHLLRRGTREAPLQHRDHFLAIDHTGPHW